MFKKLIPILTIAILGILDFALIGFAWQNPTQAPPGGNLTLPWIKSGTNVYLANTSDKVGIGVTNPTIKLAIGDSDTGIQWVSEGNLGIYTNNAERIRIDSAGNVGIGTTTPGEKLEVNGNVKATAFYYGSDKSLKTNIKPFGKSLQRILNLEPVYFDYKENNQHSFGFIAQDVEKQFPELVTTDSLTGLKSLDYSRLTAPLVMAIKEQQEQINVLTQIVESQQQQINELKMK